MSNGSDGRFSKEQLQAIREAHREWCEERAIEPGSIAGRDAAAAMMLMFMSGKIWKHQLMAWHGREDAAHQ